MRSDASGPGVARAAKRGFVDHRSAGHATRARSGAVVLAERHGRIRNETGSRQLLEELRLGQEALGRAGELGEHEGLAVYRLDLGGERMAGESEDEEAGSRPGDPRRLAHGATKLGRRGREVPDAVGDDEVGAAI